MKSIFENSYVLEAGTPEKIKNYSDCYLYSKGNYDKKLFEFLMHCEYVDKTDESFSDLESDIRKRQVTSSLSKVLESSQTRLCIGEESLPRAFKVFVAKDIKGDKSLKAFIDVTGIIKKDNGRYVYSSNDIDILISYLIGAMNAKIYYTEPSRLTNRNSLVEDGIKCFSGLFYYIIDYLRINSIDNARAKCLYLAAKYYQICLLGKEESESVENKALKISGLSEKEAQLINIYLENISEPYKNIDTFIKAIAVVLKTNSLTLDVFIDKWMFLYGVGSQFATELYPAFANMIIYAYVGAYLNNQKTIEKVIGRPMVDFVNELFKVGSELL
jgi:hypothetical protein